MGRAKPEAVLPALGSCELKQFIFAEALCLCHHDDSVGYSVLTQPGFHRGRSDQVHTPFLQHLLASLWVSILPGVLVVPRRWPHVPPALDSTPESLCYLPGIWPLVLLVSSEPDDTGDPSISQHFESVWSTFV